MGCVVTFPGKHKLRRIKARSTARVFGFYTTANYLSKNDNLVTVLCFRAVRDDLLFSFRSIQIQVFNSIASMLAHARFEALLLTFELHQVIIDNDTAVFETLFDFFKLKP